MKEFQLDLYQFHHQHHLMALDQTKLELYDLELDLYAMDQIYHVQVGAPMAAWTSTSSTTNII